MMKRKKIGMLLVSFLICLLVGGCNKEKSASIETEMPTEPPRKNITRLEFN